MPGQSTEQYLRQSILEPGSYVVEGYSNVMPSFRGQLTDQELNDIVAYLLTLR